jgi:hypothetical protein
MIAFFIVGYNTQNMAERSKKDTEKPNSMSSSNGRKTKANEANIDQCGNLVVESIQADDRGVYTVTIRDPKLRLNADETIAEDGLIDGCMIIHIESTK